MTPIYEMLFFLGNEGSRKKKEKALVASQGSSILRNTLVYAMSPYKRFHIKRVPDHIVGEGTEHIDSFTWEFLDMLVDCSYSGAEAKTMLHSYIRSLNHWDADVVKRIIHKKLKCGVSQKTINLVWPDAIPERGLNLAERYSESHVILPSLVSIKIDGLRAELKNGMFMTRGGGVITGLEHITAEVADVGYSVHLDGELWIPGMSFDKMSGYLRRHDTVKADAKFLVFDNLSLKKYDQLYRYQSLAHIMGSMHQSKGPIGFVPHYLVQSRDEIMSMFTVACTAGHEGIMVKNPKAPYSGLRTYDWMKLKRGIEREYIIDKLFESEEVPGTMGGYYIQVKGRQIRVGTGFTHKQREEWWQNKRKYQGAIATIHAMEETATSLRPPIVHKTIRWDI